MGNTSKSTEKINYGLNLLRIVAMLFIVGEHFIYHGLQLYKPLEFNWNLAISFAYLAFAKVDVNCFVLISGYFLIFSNQCSWRHLGKLWGKTIFYSIGLMLLILPISDWAIKPFLRSAMPVKLELYWFVTAYIGLYLLHPFINRAVKELPQKKFLHVVFLFIGMFCLYSFKGDTFYTHFGRGILWLMTLYLIGGYIRVYGLPITNRQSFALYIFCSLLTFGISAGYFEYKGLFFSDSIFANNQPLTLLASVAFFCIFLNLQIKDKTYQKMIQWISSSVFSVYLIHEQWLVRRVIWQDWLQVKTYYTEWYFVIYWFVCTVFVFCACILIDKCCWNILKMIRIYQNESMNNFQQTLIKKIQSLDNIVISVFVRKNQ